MLDKSYKWPLIFALLLHVIIFICLFIEFPTHNRIPVIKSSKNVNIIKAIAVSQKQVEKQIAQIKEEKRRKREAKLARLRKIRERKLRLAKARRFAKIKVEKEKARKLKLKRAKIAREKALVAAAVKRKKLLEQKRRRQERKKQLAIMQKSMHKQIASEQKRMTLQERRMQSEVEKYKALILQDISQYWIQPPNLPKGIYCKLLVHVAPGGSVLRIDVIRRSGNAALDRSAKTAILKASPLPVPKNAELFNNFRLIRLTVRPEGVF